MSYDCFCDYDPPSVYSRSTPKAKKAHRCEECGSPILPGDTYEYVWGIWEGYPGSFKTCSHCVGMRTWVKNNIPCFCWAHGNLIEDCRNAIEYAYEQARDEVRGVAFGFGRLLVKAKRARREKAAA